MNELDAGDIHLWLAFYDEIVDAQLHAVYRLLLNEQERQQQTRFYFERDRLRYLVTRALVRTVLSRYLDLAPVDWVFKTNEYGRPYIANEQVDTCGLCFNISHTQGLIAMGVTREREIGVDVENICQRSISIDIADRFFAPEEAVGLAQVPIEQQQERFFEYWTFKEAYIKARGMGLSIPLEKFSFRYPHDRGVEIAIDAVLEDDPRRWRFWQFRPTSEHILAVCAERLTFAASQVLIRRVVPACEEHVLVPAFTRISE